MSQIQITLRQIKEHEPCVDGWRKVVEANGGPNADIDKPFPVSSILESNDLDDTLWVLRCLPEHDHLWRKFAWWCASSVSHLANDERVDDCLKAVWHYAEGNATPEELEAAQAAADAAATNATAAVAWAADAAAKAADADTASNAQKQKLKEILDCGEFKQEKEKQ